MTDLDSTEPVVMVLQFGPFGIIEDPQVFLVGVPILDEPPFELNKSLTHWFRNTLEGAPVDVELRKHDVVRPGDNWRALLVTATAAGSWTAIASVVRAFINRRKGNSVTIYKGEDKLVEFRGTYTTDEISNILHAAMPGTYDHASSAEASAGLSQISEAQSLPSREESQP